MSLRHIASALRFSRLTAFFLILQTALACAIVCNALFFIAQQAAPMLAATGVVADQVLYVDQIAFPSTLDQATGSVSGGANLADLRALQAHVRAMPGVQSVALDLGMPYTSGFNAEGNWLDEKGNTSAAATLYMGDHLVDALGLQLIEGRDFLPEEIQPTHGMEMDASVAIITADVAQQLFPAGHALGQRIVMGKDADALRPVVIGVVKYLAARQPTDTEHANATVIMPIIPGDGFFMANAVVRAKPGQTDAVARALPAQLREDLHLSPTAEPRVRRFETLRDDYFSANRNMILLLLGVTLAVVAITVIGIMGLTGFWVQRRRRQIGIRRALGATRGDILRQFLLENFLVVSVGIVFGMLAAYAGNLWLMTHLEMARLPLFWLPVGALVLWALGQLAVLSPALRAAAVPPVVATRSV
ncbi:ABC transporter permease [Rhodanobacter sp. AS-Z3]|uniref:ABC transporter permease n=1 Tax=Rhodanobacter sp. AS-Z3 TaxID=3031330 RepID=UPI0024792985|nr:FtsX-like permease family protein [Rhodanobacter sp. AS-Z3]WEN16235.1 ABC transporter permease [Rhodanobacter sp. AS-Z3]